MENPENVFDFWLQKSNEFPTLSRLAFSVFCVPATSAPVELIFSKSGLILRPHRSSMSSDMLAMQVYLKSNPETLFQ